MQNSVRLLWSLETGSEIGYVFLLYTFEDKFSGLKWEGHFTDFVLKWGQGLKDMPHTPFSPSHSSKSNPRISASTRTVSFYGYLKNFVDVFALMIDLCAVWLACSRRWDSRGVRREVSKWKTPHPHPLAAFLCHISLPFLYNLTTCNRLCFRQ